MKDRPMGVFEDYDHCDSGSDLQKLVGAEQLKDAVLNLLGAFDSPVRRIKFPSDFGDEVIKLAKEALRDAGYPVPGEIPGSAQRDSGQ